MVDDRAACTLGDDGTEEGVVKDRTGRGVIGRNICVNGGLRTKAGWPKERRLLGGVEMTKMMLWFANDGRRRYDDRAEVARPRGHEKIAAPCALFPAGVSGRSVSSSYTH